MAMHNVVEIIRNKHGNPTGQSRVVASYSDPDLASTSAIALARELNTLLIVETVQR